MCGAPASIRWLSGVAAVDFVFLSDQVSTLALSGYYHPFSAIFSTLSGLFGAVSLCHVRFVVENDFMTRKMDVCRCIGCFLVPSLAEDKAAITRVREVMMPLLRS